MPIRSLDIRPAQHAIVLASLPLVALVTALVLSVATGRAPVTSAGAADIEVTGSLIGEVFLDTSACAPASGAIGDVLPGVDPWKTAQDATGTTCSLAFGSLDHYPGTNLIMIDDPATSGVGGPALRCTTGSCAGRSIGDYSGAGEPAVNTSAFGTQLLGSGGVAAPVWSAAPAVHDVQDASDIPCRTSTVGTGTCSFTWGLTAAAADVPGDYRASVQSLVVAR